MLSAPLARSTSTVLTGDEYLLGAGDRLHIDILSAPEYSGEYAVLSDGSVYIPLVGTIPVQGLSLSQATDTIESYLLAALRRPYVNLLLLEPRPVTVAIAGEVIHPGSYTIAEPETSGIPTVTQVLQLAGGVTQSADVGQIVVRREVATNRYQEITIDLWDLIQTGDLSQDLALRDGDSILIPTATDLTLEESRRLASATFAAEDAEPIQVAVVGEVNRPGPYTLSIEGISEEDGGLRSLTVSQAIRTAGGITQFANVRDIEIQRTSYDGDVQTITVDFWSLLQSGDLTQDARLQTGDRIIVPTATALDPAEVAALSAASFSPDSVLVNVIGEVAQPGSVDVPPNTSLNQALLTAGGFTSRSRRGTVELIRLNPDGTVTQQTLSVDLDESLNSENNPILRPNDTIIVGRSGLASFSDTLGLLLSPITGAASLLRLLGL
jgi:polysaccharide export outer membrane protein